MKAAVIHGNKSQGARTRALGDFKAGRVTVLVATDIAARGLDIAQLPLVVNYDLPLVAEDYIHRIGRTGRAGRSGRAVSLVSASDSVLLRDIQRLLTDAARARGDSGVRCAEDTAGRSSPAAARQASAPGGKSVLGTRQERPRENGPFRANLVSRGLTTIAPPSGGATQLDSSDGRCRRAARSRPLLNGRAGLLATYQRGSERRRDPPPPP